MKLTEVIKIWDILHTKDTGELGYCDLERAIDTIVGVENDVSFNQPRSEIAWVDKLPAPVQKFREMILSLLPETP